MTGINSTAAFSIEEKTVPAKAKWQMAFRDGRLCIVFCSLSSKGGLAWIVGTRNPTKI